MIESERTMNPYDGVESKIPDEPDTTTAVQAKTKDIPEDIKKDLTCAICMDIFTNAVQTQCTHTFCQVCIEQWKATSSQCPTCKGKMGKLKPNRMARNIVSTYRPINVIENCEGRNVENENTTSKKRKANHEKRDRSERPERTIRDESATSHRREVGLCDSCVSKVLLQSSTDLTEDLSDLVAKNLELLCSTCQDKFLSTIDSSLSNQDEESDYRTALMMSMQDDSESVIGRPVQSPSIANLVTQTLSRVKRLMHEDSTMGRGRNRHVEFVMPPTFSPSTPSFSISGTITPTVNNQRQRNYHTPILNQLFNVANTGIGPWHIRERDIKEDLCSFEEEDPDDDEEEESNYSHEDSDLDSHCNVDDWRKNVPHDIIHMLGIDSAPTLHFGTGIAPFSPMTTKKKSPERRKKSSKKKKDKHRTGGQKKSKETKNKKEKKQKSKAPEEKKKRKSKKSKK